MNPEVANLEVNVKSGSLYDADYQRWLDDTIAQLKARNFQAIDVENLIEEMESLGKSDKRAIASYLMRLCEHLLKIAYWESERAAWFRGWVLEVNNFRWEIASILQDSPSLQQFLRANFAIAYQKARKNLVKVVPSFADLLPETPNFTLEQALEEDWLPWQPE